MLFFLWALCTSIPKAPLLFWFASPYLFCSYTPKYHPFSYFHSYAKATIILVNPTIYVLYLIKVVTFRNSSSSLSLPLIASGRIWVILLFKIFLLVFLVLVFLDIFIALLNLYYFDSSSLIPKPYLFTSIILNCLYFLHLYHYYKIVRKSITL